MKLIEKVESVIKRMRWKVHFYLRREKEEENDDGNIDTKKENYGFKSRKCPQQCSELENFEKDLLEIVKNIKFRTIKNNFQGKLKSPDVFIFADKTSNIYKLKPAEHKKFFMNNITKTYKKAPSEFIDMINKEAKIIAEKLELDDRIEHLAFITMKDHKEDFRSNPKCRLINPSKSELGKVSKIILKQVKTNLRDSLVLSQWKNTGKVIDRFTKIQHKSSCTFIQLDIENFYPSISESILDNAINLAKDDNAINLAKDNVRISEEQFRIIKHCRNSLLFDNETPWIKRIFQDCFT